MTVQELINTLNTIEDKNREIRVACCNMGIHEIDSSETLVYSGDSVWIEIIL